MYETFAYLLISAFTSNEMIPLFTEIFNSRHCINQGIVASNARMHSNIPKCLHARPAVRHQFAVNMDKIGMQMLPKHVDFKSRSAEM